jgi:hypothetical protein
MVLMWRQQAVSQEFPKPDYNLESLADELFPLQDRELNYEDLYENLLQRLVNPLDINRVSEEELRSIFVLKENQIRELLSYRENSHLISIYELQSIPSFDLTTIYRLLPFVRVGNDAGEASLFKRLIHEKNNYFLLRHERTVEKKLGHRTSTDQRYVGSPDKLYGRFRVSKTNDFSAGFTFEKDAGEAWRWNSSQHGFDFHSGHIQIYNQHKITNMILGDYQAQFGQGLVLGGGFGMGKGAETITTLRRSNLGFLPYTSVNEFGFFRGGAITTTLSKRTFVSLFASSLHRDGAVKEDSTENSSLSSFLLSGLHRTSQEIGNRKLAREVNFGTSIEYKNNSIQAGALFHHTQYQPFFLRSPSLYNQFAFQGEKNSNVSGFANYTFQNFAMFTEVAQTLQHGNAVVAGLLGSVSHEFDISVLYRRFARNFYSFYSNAISENTTPQNESGFYWGWKYLPSKKSTWSGYVDLFRFPWLRYRAYAPSDGSEWLVKFHYRASRAVNTFIQVREEIKIRNLDTETISYQTKTGRKRNFCVNADYTTGPFQFKSRLQYSQYQLAQTTHGFALIQDAAINLRRFSVATRYALFDTDDFENRQYVYEKDVWLAYSLPGYYGKGVRSYVVIQYQLSQKVDLWVRWAQTTYRNKDFIGASGEQIEGNSKNDLKFQARIRL